VYKKGEFKLSNDSRLDGIQDWYWNLENAINGDLIFINSCEYNHRIHTHQNTNSERFLKSVSKTQLQSEFIALTKRSNKDRSIELSEEQKLDLLTGMRNSSISQICLIANDKISFFPYSPSLLLNFIKNDDKEIQALIIVPRAVIEFSEIYFYLDRNQTPLVGMVSAVGLHGSIQTLKNLGGLLDFCVALDLDAEIFASMAGIRTYHLSIETVLYHSIQPISRIEGIQHFLVSIHNSNRENIERLFPRGSKRRIIAVKLFRRIQGLN
jgi:hypothetical protein